ncbi:MAG: hypothetical protein ACI97K_003082 [Glaciecola sp.]
MGQGNTLNPLKSLILEATKSAKMSRPELAIACGYQNISKGLRNIDNFVENLTNKNNVSESLRAALDISNVEYKEAIKKQRHRLSEALKSSFKPSLQVMFSGKVTSPVFTAKFLLDIPLPESTSNLSFDEEMQLIFELYKANQLHHFQYTKYVEIPKNYQNFVANLEAADMNCEAYFYGISKGYRYHKKYNECYTFNRHGKLISKALHTNKYAGLSHNGKDINLTINTTNNAG